MNKKRNHEGLPLPKTVSSDVIKYGILPFVEPSCDVISEGGKYCSRTWEFKTKSNKTANCKHYCRDHMDKWVQDIFNIEYFLENKEEDIPFKINSINIKGELNIDPSLSFLNNRLFEITIDKYLNNEILNFGSSSNIFETLKHFNIFNIEFHTTIKTQYPIMIKNEEDEYENVVNCYMPDRDNIIVYDNQHIQSKGWTICLKASRTNRATSKRIVEFDLIKNLYNNNNELFKQYVLDHENEIIEQIKINEPEISSDIFTEYLEDEINLPSSKYVEINRELLEYIANNINQNKLNFKITYE